MTAVIDWTPRQLKLTAGIGGLGTVALASFALGKVSETAGWIMVGASCLPFVMFLLFHPDHFGPKVVLAGQVFASLFYIVWVVFISVVLFLGGPDPAVDSCGWPIL